VFFSLKSDHDDGCNSEVEEEMKDDLDFDKEVESKQRNRMSRLEKLPCYESIKKMIMLGAPLTDIADHIQLVEGEYTDVERNTVVSALSRNKRKLNALGILRHRDPDFVERAKKEVAEAVDEIKELAELIQMQKDRIDSGVQSEGQIDGLLFSSNERAMHTLVKMLAESHSMKMDLGVNGGRELGRLKITPEFAGEMIDKHGVEVGEAVSNNESISKVLGIVKQMAALGKDDKDDNGDS